MSLPWWKLRRELRWMVERHRVRRDLRVAPSRTRAYDAARARSVLVADGGVAPGDKVCIFLIYQPHGVAASVVETCAFLTESGYAVMVVSNAALSGDDRVRLWPGCWKLVERPNVGHDFGGYREGVAQLHDMGVAPRLLMLLNDSVWFPVGDGRAHLAALEASAADLDGGFLRRGHRPPVRHWIESYNLRFTAAALQSEYVTAFWRDYLLTEVKRGVVHRGELGLSIGAAEAGLSVDGRGRNDMFLHLMGRQPPLVLNRTLTYFTDTDPVFDASRRDLLAGYEDTDGWRRAALSCVERTVYKRAAPYLMCYPAVSLMNFPFLKKSVSPWYSQLRRHFVDAVDAGDLPDPGPSILSEVRAAVAADRAAGRGPAPR